MGFEGNSLRFI